MNRAKYLPNDFWNFNADDLKDLDTFYKKAAQKIKELLPATIDERKSKRFQLIYASNGRDECILAWFYN